MATNAIVQMWTSYTNTLIDEIRLRLISDLQENLQEV